MARKPPSNLFEQTKALFQTVVRRNTGPGSGGNGPHPPSGQGQHDILPLSGGLRLTLGAPVSQGTLDVLAEYLQPGFSTYLLPWPEAVRLYPELIPTALPDGLRQAVDLPPWPEGVISPSTHAPEEKCTGEGIALPGTEQSQLWDIAALELRNGLPKLDDIGSFKVKVLLHGNELSLVVQAHNNKLVDPIRPGWLVMVGSFRRVAAPLWLWQLHAAQQRLQHWLNNPETRKHAYGLLQRVQQVALQCTPHHAVILDDRRLTDQRFVSVSQFQVAVARSRYGNTADVLPHSDQLADILGLEPDELQRSMQQAVANWNGQDTLILKDSDQNDVHASIMLSSQQIEAIRYLKDTLFQKSMRDIKQFVYFPTDTAKSTAFQDVFALDLSEYGPRVTGIGPIIHSPSAFGKVGTKSLFERIGFMDLDWDHDASQRDNTCGVAEPVPQAQSRRTYAEDDEAKANPILEIAIANTNNETEPPTVMAFEMATLPDTLNEMKAQLEDDANPCPLFTFTHPETGQEEYVPLTAPFVEAIHTAFIEEKQAIIDEAAERKQFVQVAETGEAYQPEMDTDKTARLYKLAKGWTKQIPKLKTHLETKPLTLFPYQTEGIAWLTSAFLQGKAGVLFADDMGLGKTLQSLAFLSLLIDKAWYQRHHQAQSLLYDKQAFKKTGHCPHPMLIVVPPVLMQNFEKQAHTFFEDASNHFSMLLLHADQGQQAKDFFIDPKQTGSETDDGLPRLDRQKLLRYRMIVTTYDYVQTYQHSFARIPWSVLLCDEVQKAKNGRSKLSVALKGIASKACFKIMMTGTPVENDHGDLFNLMDIAAPGLMAQSPQAFRKAYGPLFNMGLAGKSSEEVDAAIADCTQVLKTQIGFNQPESGHMVGRLKTEVGEGLPDKYDGPDQTIVTPIPFADYRILWDRYPNSIQRLLALKQYSLHPNHQEPFNDANVVEWAEASPRLQAVLKQLDKIQHQGEKALIFCEFHVIQEGLQKAINRRYQLPKTLKAVNSNLTTKESVIAEFQNHAGFCALVLSPRCAGMGLNLQEANHVFHVSRWWNPAVEDQATCRAYRTGQKKDVFVYYCHSRFDDAPDGERTFDEVLHELLAEKRQKRTDLLDPGYARDVAPESYL